MTTPVALNSRTDAYLIRQGDRLLATLCVTAAEHLVRLKFLHLVAVVRHAKRTCRRPATTAEAGRITAAVHHVARHRAGRVACLEYSLAAVLLGTLRRRSMDWCIGARLMPYASHAWVQTDGSSVGEPDTRDRPYHVLLRV